MKLIAGLGNPGQRYIGTRHNIGFEAIRRLRLKLGGDKLRGKFDSDFTESIIAGEKLVLMCPLTFMNLSGRSVQAAVDFFSLPLPNLLVICDDLNLPLGSVRLRSSGSAGGQKGLQNICNLLGSQMFPRLRIGIGAAPPNWDAADYVLAKFSAEEKIDVDRAIDAAVEAALVWMNSGMEVAMARFNGSGNKVDSALAPDVPKPRQKINRPSED